MADFCALDQGNPQKSVLPEDPEKFYSGSQPFASKPLKFTTFFCGLRAVPKPGTRLYLDTDSHPIISGASMRAIEKLSSARRFRQ